MIRLRVRPRGPLTVELGDDDDLELVGADGQPIDLDGRKKVALCRCGASAAKPFCDGSHNRIAFEAPPPGDAPES